MKESMCEVFSKETTSNPNERIQKFKNRFTSWKGVSNSKNIYQLLSENIWPGSFI